MSDNLLYGTEPVTGLPCVECREDDIEADAVALCLDCPDRPALCQECLAEHDDHA